MDENNDIEIIPRPKIGKPSDYTPAACDAVILAAAEGKHVAGMILAAGANSRTTYYEWQKKYPEFKEACDYAKIVSQSVWEDIGVKGTVGQIKNFNAASYALVMNNKFSDDYSRTGTAAGTTNITVNTVNLSDEQKVMRLQGLAQKLTSAGISIDQLLPAPKNDDSDK